jgi:hypothetical protein
MLTPKLLEFVNKPNGMGVGTVDSALKPEFQRVLGAIALDEEHIKIFIDQPSAGRTLGNLKENGRMAVVMVDIQNAESFQFKGLHLRTEDLSDTETDLFNKYMMEFDSLATAFGFPARGVYQYAHSKMIALTMRVESIYEQTPRKGTGHRVI